ncbi:SDR family oxidoreductase [Rhodococcus sp. NPDC057014]|uniref:SDR family oxidoreductase n=1 Tax=Rhodococcus sp. NPDC057014 TaxID=3346000 RepID=UPI00363F6B82
MLTKPEKTPVAVVTGAANGMGRAISERLLDDGYGVVAVDVDAPTLTEMENAHERMAAVPRSVADVELPGELSKAVRTLGTLAVLVNNAAISPKVNGFALPSTEISGDEWEQVFTINLTAPFRLCQWALPQMRAEGWGRIVNISSMAARTASKVPGTHYAASKAGLLGLTRSLAIENAEFGITVNAIAPGRVESLMAAESDTALNDDYRRRLPVGRFGRPAEIAAAVAYLASEAAGFTTGATLDVNGGMLMI